MVFAFGEAAEEVVEGVFAHGGDGLSNEKKKDLDVSQSNRRIIKLQSALWQ